MAIYVPGFNPFKCICNIPYAVDNLVTKIKYSFKDLNYEEIIKIEYNSMELPEILEKSLDISKDNMTKEDLNYIVKN